MFSHHSLSWGPDLRVLSTFRGGRPFQQGVRLRRRGVGMDEKQPIAAQPVQDRSPLVFFSASSAPDPDQSSSHWQYVSVAGVLSPGSWCLPGRRRRYEDTRHCCREIVFRGTATDP